MEIGASLARWAIDRGAQNLILVSRRGLAAPGAAELVAGLSGSGVSVSVAACDVADRAAVRALLDAVPAEHPLDAVIHAAGITDYTALSELDPQRVAAVLAGKALAADHLHELTRGLGLSAFVLFSSGAASWGSGQQGAYAAANAA